jgi:type VI secretion system Hcp family effector
MAGTYARPRRWVWGSSPGEVYGADNCASREAENREVRVNIRHGLMAWTSAAALAVIPATALAAVDAFIWFEGVQGPVEEPAHKGAFEIKDFSFVGDPTGGCGMSCRATNIGSASSGAGAGKVKFNEFTITKATDKASPSFFKHAQMTGQHFPKVKIEMRKAGGGERGQFMDYTFTNVFPTKINWSGPGDEGPEESITFVYGSMTLHYAKQGVGEAQGRSPMGLPPPPGAAGAPVKGLPPPGPNQPHR